MANSQAKVKREAEAITAVCNEAVSLLTRLKQILDHNSDISVDWANGDVTSGGAAISTDADGNITDLMFSPADVSNCIGSLDNVRKAFENEAVTQGDHLGNLKQASTTTGVTMARVLAEYDDELAAGSQTLPVANAVGDKALVISDDNEVPFAVQAWRGNSGWVSQCNVGVGFINFRTTIKAESYLRILTDGGGRLNCRIETA